MKTLPPFMLSKGNKNGITLLVSDPINIDVTNTTNNTPPKMTKYIILLTLTSNPQNPIITTKKYLDNNTINPKASKIITLKENYKQINTIIKTIIIPLT